MPSDSTLAVMEPQYCAEELHRIESEVRRALIAQPDLHFKVLIVRRVKDGVCLEGVVDADDGAPDITQLAGQVDDVGFVINRLMVRTPRHQLRTRC
ncbi:MAG: BON domain-containing protein [Planctomycetaceae bacterium]|nr:BON domain-containing protein [Planctomycetaceae bacterium]